VFVIVKKKESVNGEKGVETGACKLCEKTKEEAEPEKTLVSNGLKSTRSEARNSSNNESRATLVETMMESREKDEVGLLHKQDEEERERERENKSVENDTTKAKLIDSQKCVGVAMQTQ
jgi:hypothetical protein